MAIAKRPSKITLPPKNNGWNNLLEFLVEQFPLIEESIWIARFSDNKIHWISGEMVNQETPFKPSQILCYYREVPDEPIIPFQHQIIFRNEHILIADKPHFLPVTPGGIYVNECLLERIRQQENLSDIVTTHRLDRETAGLVMFSINPQTRGDYCQLFAKGEIEKHYQAIAKLTPQALNQTMPQNWQIANRLAKSKPSFLMHEVDGEINARSEISLIAKQNNFGLFDLKPITGKTHQLRLHMLKIGMPILNDKFYPILLADKKLDFDSPLQLLAKKLSFRDPITKKHLSFESSRGLNF